MPGAGVFDVSEHTQTQTQANADFDKGRGHCFTVVRQYKPSRARSGLTTPTAGAETKLSLFHGVCARAPSQAAWPPRKSDASFQALHTWIEANVRRKHGGPTQVGGQTKRQAARGHRDLAFMQLVSAEFPDAVNSPDMLAASPCYNFSS